MPESPDLSSRDLLAKSKSTKNEEQDRHHNEDGEGRPVFEEMCTAQNDSAHQRDEIGRREERAKRVKNPWHGFPWKDEAGEENTRQQEHHRHLQRLHLIFRFGSYQQPKTEEREHIDE